MMLAYGYYRKCIQVAQNDSGAIVPPRFCHLLGITVDRADLKIYAVMAAVFIGMLWWFHFGYKLIFNDPQFEAFIASYRGYGIFSIKSIMLWLVLTSAMLYPLVVWLCVCLAVLDPSLIRDMVFSKKALWVWFAPISFTLLVAFIVVLRTLASLVWWLFFLGGVGYIVFSIFRGLAETVVKKWDA